MPLQYALNAGNTSYSVVGNSCTAGEVIIPTGYNNLPVTRIGNSAFSNCNSITNVIMQSGINIIDNYAFYFCPLLTGVTFPPTLTSIGISSFSNSPLKTVELPKINNISIADAAFYGCTGFSVVDIPSNITSIGRSAFTRCCSLTGFNVSGNNLYYTGVSGVLFDKSLSTILCFPGGKKDNFYTPPQQTYNIGPNAFYEATGLSGISANNINYIGDGAFHFCYKLTGIDLKNNLTYIGINAFSSCTGIKNITIPSTINSLSEGTFSSCYNLSGITLPNSMTSIGGTAFFNTFSLKNISLPNSLNSLGFQVFQSSAITDIAIPDATKTFGTSIFGICTGLISVKFGTGMSFVASSMFNGCSNLTTLSSFYNITGISNSAFQFCTKLNKVFFNKNINKIDNNAFLNCTNLIGTYFDGNAPTVSNNSFTNTSGIFKVYRKKNFVTGWSSQLGGKPVVLWSDNVVKSGGSGKLTTWNRSVDRDALKYIQLIESLTNPNNPITQDGKDKINNFIKQIKQIVPWNNFTAWTFIRGQNAFPFLNFTDNKYNGIVKTFGGLGGGEVISANSSTNNGNEGLFFSNPGGVLAISPSSFFTSVKSIFGVFKPTDNFYFSNPINQSIFSVYGSSGPTSYTYSNLYYRSNAVYSKITRNSIDNIQTNNIGVFNLNFYKSFGTIFDANSTSNYSNGIKQFTASPLSVPNASLFNGVSIGGGIVNGGTIPFVFVSDLVLTDAQMLAIHNIYKSTLGASLTNSQL